MENLIINILKCMVCGKIMRRREKWKSACAQFYTGSDVVEGGGEGMVITKIIIFVQIWGRVKIIVVYYDGAASASLSETIQIFLDEGDDALAN